MIGGLELHERLRHIAARYQIVALAHLHLRGGQRLYEAEWERPPAMSEPAGGCSFSSAQFFGECEQKRSRIGFTEALSRVRLVVPAEMARPWSPRMAPATVSMVIRKRIR